MGTPRQFLGLAESVKVESGRGEEAATPVLPEAGRNVILCKTAVFRTWPVDLSIIRFLAHFAFLSR